MLLKEKKLDPRVIRTRRDLAHSLCSLLRQKSFSQITVQEISEQAIINRATFYAHFEDKFRLLEFMVQGSFQEMLDKKIGADATLIPDNLTLLMLTTCEFLEEFDDQYAPRAGQEHPPIERQIQPHIYRLLLQWIERGGPMAQSLHSPETVATMISWTLLGSALQWSRSKRNMSAAQVTDEVMSLLLDGLPF